MSKSPAFQFYAADYLADADIQMMSLEDEGCYIRLLAYCWREGHIPNNEKKLRALCKGGSTTLMQMVEGCFNQHPADSTKLVHPRLEMEREKQRVWRQKSAEGGKKSAEKRAQQQSKTKGGLRVVEPPHQPKSNSSSSSSYNNLSPSARARSRAEVVEFVESLGLPESDGSYLWHSWESNGWKRGSKPLKDWRAAVRAWKEGGFLPSQKNLSGRNPKANRASDSGSRYADMLKGDE